MVLMGVTLLYIMECEQGTFVGHIHVHCTRIILSLIYLSPSSSPSICPSLPCLLSSTVPLSLPPSLHLSLLSLSLSPSLPPSPPPQVHIVPSNSSDGKAFYHVSCERHIFTSFLIPDILLLSSFIYGLYIFRWAQTEQLSTLTEAVSSMQSRQLLETHTQPYAVHTCTSTSFPLSSGRTAAGIINIYTHTLSHFDIILYTNSLRIVINNVHVVGCLSFINTFDLVG